MAIRVAAVETFAFLKEARSLDGLLARAVPLESGWLLPVGELHREDDKTIAMLGRWRARHMDVHPTQFVVTEAGTRRWLGEAIIDNPDRLLFLITDQLGRPVGQLGLSLLSPDWAFASADVQLPVELGYLIRGEPAAPSLMTQALAGATGWCHRTLPGSTIYALTLSDNRRALRLFERCGGVRVGTMPLRRHAQPGRMEYRPLGASDGAPPDREYVVLQYSSAAGISGHVAHVPLAGPSIDGREVAYTLDAVRHGWNRRRTEYLDRLSSAFAAAVGVRFALPTSSCTGAMHLALLAAGIGPGDEVIVPDLTWVATANAVALAGARPVFADIEPESWGLDPAALRAAISPRTRAVIAVHLYGYPAQIAEIREIADAHGLLLVEDAAAAAGASVDGRPVGSWGAFAAFSFQGAKLLVAGEGGMLVTNDEHHFKRALHLSDQARAGGHPFWVDAVTPKYKMSNVQAALALAQVERLPLLLAAKRRLHDWYREELARVPCITLLSGDPVTEPSHWMASILLDRTAALDRDTLARALGAQGIDTRPTFLPLSTLPMWREQTGATGPVTTRVGATGLNLPSGVALERRHVAAVGSAIRDLLGAA